MAIIAHCPTALKSHVNVWGSTPTDVAAMRAVRVALDPKQILNRGRFRGLSTTPHLASTEQRSHFTTLDRPTWDLYSTCIHCGLCLEQCPTYRVLGLEADSPRGRIYQILQVDQGNLAIADSFVTHIDRCLGCLACQTACPSGVNYGHIVERARAEIEQNYRRPLLARLARRYTYKKLLTNFRVLAFWAKLVRFYQRSSLQETCPQSWHAETAGVEK